MTNNDISEFLSAVYRSNFHDDKVLNPDFSSFNSLIRERLDLVVDSKLHIDDHRYQTERSRPLLEACQEHEQRYSSNQDSRMSVEIVHPFFFWFREDPVVIDFLERRHSTDVENYKANLQRLVDLRKEGADFELIIRENPDDYARGTSLLLEEGLIDGVHFTRYAHGDSVREKRNIEGKVLFTAGSYLNSCYNDFLDELPELSNYYAIEGLITRHVSPLTTYSMDLFPNLEGNLDIPPVINMDELERRLTQ